MEDKKKTISEIVTDLQSQNTKLQQELQFEKYRVDTLQNQVAIANSGIANQLNVFLLGFGILAAIFGIFLNWLFSKTSRAAEAARLSQQAMQEMKQDIDTNLKRIYDGIKLEEFNSIMLRLTQVPDDIAHYKSYFLGKASLPRDVFSDIKSLLESFMLKDPSGNSNYEEIMQYGIIMLQHYPKRTFEDSVIWKKLTPYFNGYFNSFFDIDLKNFLLAIFANRSTEWFLANREGVKTILLSWQQSEFFEDVYIEYLHGHMLTDFDTKIAVFQDVPEVKPFIEKIAALHANFTPL